MEASDFPTYTDLESQASCDVLNLLLAVVLDTQVTALVSSHAQIKLFMASPTKRNNVKPRQLPHLLRPHKSNWMAVAKKA